MTTLEHTLDAGNQCVLVVTDGTSIEARADLDLVFEPETPDSGGALLTLHIGLDMGALGQELVVTLPIRRVVELVRLIDGATIIPDEWMLRTDSTPPQLVRIEEPAGHDAALVHDGTGLTRVSPAFLTRPRKVVTS